VRSLVGSNSQILFFALPSHQPAPLHHKSGEQSKHMDCACIPIKSSHCNAKPSEYDYSHISHLHTSTLPNWFRVPPCWITSHLLRVLASPFLLHQLRCISSLILLFYHLCFITRLNFSVTQIHTWLTRSSSRLMQQLQTVGCGVTALKVLCNLASFFLSNTYNLLSPLLWHPPIRFLCLNNKSEP
jgi:hypothetical protein